MSVLQLLIPCSIVLASGFLLACLFAIQSGQFDDLESPRWRILFDEGNGIKTMGQELGEGVIAMEQKGIQV